MKEIKNQRANAIFTSDSHLREDQPLCRTDKFWNAQWAKVSAIYHLQTKHKCPVIHAGDLFHHWKPSPFLLSHAIQRIPSEFMTIYGQHDLPQHNIALGYKSGLATLYNAKALKIINGVHFGQKPDSKATITIKGRKILVMHRLTWLDDKPFPGCKEPNASHWTKKFENVDVILTGDNHIPFTIDKTDTILINPGSLTRQSASQINHKPRVYLYYARWNAVAPVFLEIEKGVINREHIDKQKRINNRIEAFISSFTENAGHALSFEENLEQFLLKHKKINRKTVKIIRKIIDKVLIK